MAIPCEEPPATSSDGRGRVTNPFDEFFRARYPGAVRLAHLLTGSNAVAEELAQDAFAQLYPRFTALQEPRSYLRASVVNVCRNWHRTHHRELDRFRRHGVSDDRSTDDRAHRRLMRPRVCCALPGGPATTLAAELDLERGTPASSTVSPT